jgi:hypothetical protein
MTGAWLNSFNVFKTGKRSKKSPSRTLTAFLFDGHIRNIVNLDYDIYIAFAISAALELPADVLTIPLLDTLGRRWCGAVSLFLSAIAMAVCGLVLGMQFILMSSYGGPPKHI